MKCSRVFWVLNHEFVNCRHEHVRVLDGAQAVLHSAQLPDFALSYPCQNRLEQFDRVSEPLKGKPELMDALHIIRSAAFAQKHHTCDGLAQNSQEHFPVLAPSTSLGQDATRLTVGCDNAALDSRQSGASDPTANSANQAALACTERFAERLGFRERFEPALNLRQEDLRVTQPGESAKDLLNSAMSRGDGFLTDPYFQQAEQRLQSPRFDPHLMDR